MTAEPTTRDPAAGAPARLAKLVLCGVLLWLSGVALRINPLAVPPVLPRLHADLGLSETAVGALSGLPALIFAAAAVPGSLLIARLGAVRTLTIGLALNAVAAAARGAAGDVPALFAATIAMALGIAVMQPSLPPLVRAWLPERIAFGTAIYTNGLVVGEILVVAATLPLVLPLVGGSWRLDFLVWAAPVLLTALLVWSLAPRPGPAIGVRAQPQRWWPDWGKPAIWRLGLILGSVNSSYFTSNSFLPDYLTAAGRADLIGPALTALNVAQLPASLVMLALAGRLARRSAAYGVLGALLLLALFGMLTAGGAWIVASAALLGFAAAGTLTLVFALPPLLAAPGDIHRVSAAMFTIGYAGAVVIPILGGALWDWTGWPGAGLAPIGLCALGIALLPIGIDFGRHR